MVKSTPAALYTSVIQLLTYDSQKAALPWISSILVPTITAPWESAPFMPRLRTPDRSLRCPGDSYDDTQVRINSFLFHKRAPQCFSSILVTITNVPWRLAAVIPRLISGHCYVLVTHMMTLVGINKSFFTRWLFSGSAASWCQPVTLHSVH